MTPFRGGLRPVGRARFTLTTLTLIAVAIVTTVPAAFEPKFAVLFIPLFITWLVIAARRLRDMGRSLRWLLVPGLISPVATVAVSVASVVILAEAGLDDLTPVVLGFMIGLAVGAVIWLVFTIWLAVAPTAPSRRAR